jgi:guanyl-specific ribonuclease Sa
MRIEKIFRDRAPAFVKEAIRELRFEITNGHPTVFNNAEGHLPPAGRGNTYYEYDVGMDRMGGRGAHRIVALASANKDLIALYYTNDHYDREWTVIEF